MDFFFLFLVFGFVYFVVSPEYANVRVMKVCYRTWETITTHRRQKAC